MRLLIAALMLLASEAAAAEDGDRLEALRYNPRERTSAGIAALEQGDTGTAVERFESASRLEPANPIASFNAGTARLISGEEGAAARLEEAAALAQQDLQPAIHYNLGNARLAEQNPSAAIEAYKQVLRLDPQHMDAKFNLEVAQRLLKQQQQQQQQQQDQQEQKQNQQQSESQPDQQPQEQTEQQPQEQPEQEPQEQPEQQQGSASEDGQRERPLPDFEDQEDMTAEQAAAILEAVESLEREQRRKQAAERSRRRAASGKDW